MMKICFLDIDGVLNSDITNGKLDSRYYELLKQLVDNTDCYFVLSSSWRGMNLENTKYELSGHIIENNNKNKKRANRLQEPFPEWLLNRIIDITPRCYYFINIDTKHHFLCPRGVEIDRYLKTTKYNIENYVILDDDDDFLLNQISHLVKVDNSVGLTENEIKYCVSFFNDNFEFS